jgi:hypothetical protein
LGIRTLTAYRYSGIFRSRFDIFFCGGDVAEDMEQHLRPTLESIPGNKVSGPDTLLRCLQKKINKTLYNEELSQFDSNLEAQIENEIAKAIEKAHTYHFNLQNYRSNLTEEQNNAKLSKN